MVVPLAYTVGIYWVYIPFKGNLFWGLIARVISIPRGQPTTTPPCSLWLNSPLFPGLLPGGTSAARPIAMGVVSLWTSWTLEFQHPHRPNRPGLYPPRARWSSLPWSVGSLKMKKRRWTDRRQQWQGPWDIWCLMWPEWQPSALQVGWTFSTCWSFFFGKSTRCKQKNVNKMPKQDAKQKNRPFFVQPPPGVSCKNRSICSNQKWTDLDREVELQLPWGASGYVFSGPLGATVAFSVASAKSLRTPWAWLL